MSIADDIERLGGMDAHFDNTYWLPSADDVTAATKAYGQKLPDDYLQFIQKYGRVSFNELVAFEFPKNVPVYVHDAALGFPSAPGLGGAGLSYFYGGKWNGHATTSIAEMIHLYDGRMPDGFFPIASDVFGNKICLGHFIEGVPGVYFWDHEDEWDAEDYLEDTGMIMPDAAKYQNVYFVADSFEGLFKILQIES